MAKIQNWYSTSVAIIQIPEENMLNNGTSKEVWQKQLIIPPETDVAALDELDATFDPILLFAEKTFKPIRTDETAISK